MAFCDFAVKYDPSKDTQEQLTERILYSLYVRRMKAKKPVITFISGESGEGKSCAYLRICEILCKIQGLDLKEYLDDVNVYVPIQYPQKIRAILHDKRLKKVNMIGVHEARTLIKAKLWQNFVTQAIGDINAMSRSVKRLAIFIVSQFIRDITTDIRYTLTYYMKVSRPIGSKARLYMNVMWKDDRDLEKPKLRKRKLSGYLVYPNGKYRRFVPQYLQLTLPDKEILQRFEKSDREAKVKILNQKIDKLIKEMSKEMEIEGKKIGSMVDFYAANTDNLKLIGKRRGKKFLVNKDFKEMHDLTPTEARDFQDKLTHKLKDMGVIESNERRNPKPST